MVLMRGVRHGNMYKVLGKTIIDGCNSTIVPESKDEEIKVPDVFGEDTMLWHQRLKHIGEKGLQSLQGKGMVEGICLIVIHILISVNIVYMESRIELNSLLVLQGKNII